MASLRSTLIVLLVTVALSVSAALPVPETFRADELYGDRVTLNGAIVGLNERRTFVGFQMREAGEKRFRRVHRYWIKLESIPEPVIHQFSLGTSVKVDTDYEYRAVAIVRGVRRVGEVRSFHSNGFPPGILSFTAESIDSTTVRVSATIDPVGYPFSVNFWWSSNSFDFPSSPTMSIEGSTNTVRVSAVLSDLIPNTTYLYGIKATNKFHESLDAGEFVTTNQVSAIGLGKN